jgi:hypothetical protein
LQERTVLMLSSSFSRFINARRRIVQPMIDQSNRAGKFNRHAQQNISVRSLVGERLSYDENLILTLTSSVRFERRRTDDDMSIDETRLIENDVNSQSNSLGHLSHCSSSLFLSFSCCQCELFARMRETIQPTKDEIFFV